ncbi:MAG: Succinyl-CoA ligase (ADP-forming) subunit alpha [candidate division WS6 bacterium OLB20]|uniref:ATP citrate synthase n=1 Tax=candidate division WS6 bacterium OLB20 TaxID=1617426 RepID=A0A136LW37_9BACT|nr:MAG: Succinyl-CoA ligase (ADP-forming) subunit alpha [candidate division WS6 bacterium OLB20]
MKQLFSTDTQAIFYNEHPLPIQRMLDYDWLCNREKPSIAAIVNPNRSGMHKTFFGSAEILIPVYTTITEAAAAHPDADVMVSFASMRSAYATSLEAIMTKSIRTVAITAEGMPENQTRDLIRASAENDTWLIGPATVGGIKPGAFRIGNTAGSIESIIEARLYRPGSVGVVTISGGMSLEIYHIVAQQTDGVYEGIAIGGDTWPGSTLLDNILRLEADQGVKMHVVLGEIGGTAEYEIAKALKDGRIKKPLVIWVTGTVARQFATEVQFGHAGAKSGADDESAQAKNKALKDAGAYVPASFNDLGKLIGKVFSEHVSAKRNYREPADNGYRLPPLEFADALKQNKVRRPTSIVSSVSDDRGEEPTYNKKEISTFLNKPFGHLLNQLWFQGRFQKPARIFWNTPLKSWPTTVLRLQPHITQSSLHAQVKIWLTRLQPGCLPSAPDMAVPLTGLPDGHLNQWQPGFPHAILYYR